LEESMRILAVPICLVAIVVLLNGCSSVSAMWDGDEFSLDAARRARVAEECRAHGRPIAITRVLTTRGYAGGASVYMYWINASTKTIKYADFTMIPYNAVGDPVSCEIRRSSGFTGRETGPIEPGAYQHSGGWENAWYNSTVKCVKLTGVRLEFMDGSIEEIHEEDALRALFVATEQTSRTRNCPLGYP
jgi:hypothetical protein